MSYKFIKFRFSDLLLMIAFSLSGCSFEIPDFLTELINPPTNQTTHIAADSVLNIVSIDINGIQQASDRCLFLDDNTSTVGILPEKDILTSIVLRLREATFVQSIVILQPTDSAYATIQTVFVTADRKVLGLFNTHDTILIDSYVQEVTLSTGITNDMPELKSTEYEVVKHLWYKPTRMRKTGFSEIRFLGELKQVLHPVFQTDSLQTTVKTPEVLQAKQLVNRAISICNRIEENYTQPYIAERWLVLKENTQFEYREMNIGNQKNETWYTFISGNWSVAVQNPDTLRIAVFGQLQKTDGRMNFMPKQAFIDTLTLYDTYLQGDFAIPLFYVGLEATEMVDITTMSNNYVVDIKYATTNNFTKTKLYDCADCQLRYETALALQKAAKSLESKNLKIKILDCYRPLSVQKRMWDAYPDENYVANPDKGASIHNRGGAVDITLCKPDGTELDMGTPFDFFGEEAHHTYTDLPADVLANRKLLKQTMEAAGFVSIPNEWWHYSHRNAINYPVADTPLNCE